MKKIVKLILFCLICFILLKQTYKVLSWKDTSGSYYSSISSFYELDEDLVDVLFLGSSHCYASINNSLLWNNYGISSFSLSISGQDLASSYLCLVEALKSQTPEIVCLDVYGCTFSGYIVESNLYRNTLPFRVSIDSMKVINDMSPERSKELLFKWPIIHTRYAELQKEDFMKEKPVYLGFSVSLYSQPVEDLCCYMGDEIEQIGEKEKEWLEKIIDLAERNDINLVFFVAPYCVSEIEQKKYNHVEKIADSYGIPFINMSKMQEELSLDLETDFFDSGHTSYYGACKVSAYLGKMLKEEYRIVDHRGNDKYDLWDNDLNVRTHEYKNEILQQTMELSDYVKKLVDLEDYTVVIDNSCEGELNHYVTNEYLNLAIGENRKNQRGVFVLENGKIIKQYTDDNYLEYMDLQDEVLIVSNKLGDRNIAINQQSCIKVKNGVNIIVFDNFLGKVVDIVGFEYDDDNESGYKTVRD